MNAPAPIAPARWVPEGTSRGTVVVLVGRGEHPGLYARLGRRLAFDGWTVAAADATAGAGEVTGILDEASGARVLLGSDTGALRAWRLAENGVPVDALVLAAVPAGHDSTAIPVGPDGAASGRHEAELDVRTACPVHRGVLQADPGFHWGAIAEAPPPLPGTAPPPGIPVLWLHGEIDPVAPVDAVRELARDTDEVAVVAGGVHDVLNDQFHRIVAARLVQFLERVAKGATFVEPPAPAPAAPAARSRRAAPLHISARLDQAMRALAELVAADGATRTCDAISRARGVPLNSLVNIMLQLRRAGIVTSRRGCEGGYALARPADEVTVADVARATEGAIATVRDTGPAAVLWSDLERTVAEFLTAYTLTALAPERAAR